MAENRATESLVEQRWDRAVSGAGVLIFQTESTGLVGQIFGHSGRREELLIPKTIDI